MKYRFLLFVIFTFVFHNFNYAQSLVAEWKLWSTVDDYNYQVYGAPYVPETYYVKFGTDTMIDVQYYKKILISYDIDTANFSCIGYARENSTAKQVFYRDLEGNEGCVYDFSVEIGDTLSHLYNPLRSYLYEWDYSVKVDTIYQTNINGDLFKVFELVQLENPFAKEIITEGLGSEFGIIETGHGYSDAVGWSLSALCYWEYDELVWHSENYDYCFFKDTSNANYVIENECKIYPNPTNDILVFDFNSSIDHIELLDTHGNVLYYTKDSKLSLKTLNLKSGLYFVKICVGNREIIKKIILK